MRKTYEDNELMDLIAEQLTVRRGLVDEFTRLVGAEEGETPEVVLTLTYAEIRTLTDRYHIRKSMITKLINGLRERRLVVTHGEQCLVIEKPLEEVESVFDSLEELIVSNEECLADA